MTFIHSLQSEWLKRKGSLASWLVLCGALFTPAIVLASRLKNYKTLPAAHLADNFWSKLWNQSWEAMALILLPMGIVLGVGLITQLEFKNNTWKQLHTTPQSYLTIFCAKLTVLILMLLQGFVLFNLGIYLSGVIPVLLFKDVPYPTAPLPYQYFLSANLRFFIECLPVLTLQYLISLQFKNFLVPIGVGFMLWVLSIGMFAWEYSFILPYLHCGLDFMVSSGQAKRILPVNLPLLAGSYTAVFIIAGFILYRTKKVKG